MTCSHMTNCSNEVGCVQLWMSFYYSELAPSLAQCRVHFPTPAFIFTCDAALGRTCLLPVPLELSMTA